MIDTGLNNDFIIKLNKRTARRKVCLDFISWFDFLTNDTTCKSIMDYFSCAENAIERCTKAKGEKKGNQHDIGADVQLYIETDELYNELLIFYLGSDDKEKLISVERKEKW